MTRFQAMYWPLLMKSSLIVIITLWGRSYYAHFIDVELRRRENKKLAKDQGGSGCHGWDLKMCCQHETLVGMSRWGPHFGQAWSFWVLIRKCLSFIFLVIYLCEDFTIRNAFILSSWQNEFDPFISTSMSMSLPVSLPEPVSIFIPIHTPPTDYLYLHYLYFNLF